MTWRFFFTYILIYWVEPAHRADLKRWKARPLFIGLNKAQLSGTPQPKTPMKFTLCRQFLWDLSRHVIWTSDKLGLMLDNIFQACVVCNTNCTVLVQLHILCLYIANCLLMKTMGHIWTLCINWIYVEIVLVTTYPTHLKWCKLLDGNAGSTNKSCAMW